MNRDEAINTLEHLRKRDMKHEGHNLAAWNRLRRHIDEREKDHEKLGVLMVDLQAFVMDLQDFVDDH